jgi:hypothetical protein
VQQTAFLEPLDLITWVHGAPFIRGLSSTINPGVRAAEPDAVRAFFVAAGLAFDNGPESAKTLSTIVTTFGASATRWLLTLWHEQRHFVDHVLTNYGASQFRIGFMLRCQLETFIQAATVNGTIAFPLDAYSDPTRLSALRIKTNGPHVLSQVANFLVERRGMLAMDRDAGQNFGVGMQLDGYALLEALGSLAQLKMMGLAMEGLGYSHWNELGSAYTRFPYLAGIAPCLERAGVPVLQIPLTQDAAIGALNDAILAPLLVACLMCRRTARPRQSAGSCDQLGVAAQSAFLPAYRLHRLIDAISDARPKDMSKIEDGFDFVNKLCNQIWGQPIYDDFDEDIDFTERELARFEGFLGKHHTDVEFMRTYVAARRRLQREFKNAPASLCGGPGYYDRIAPNVIPKLVFVDAAADGPTIIAGPEGYEGQALEMCDGPYGRVRPLASVGGGGGPLSVYKIYCFDRMDVNEGRVFDVEFADRHWRRSVATSPFLSLLVDGRTQVSGRDFAIFLAEKQFRASGINVIFDVGYDKPRIERNPAYLFDMLGLDTMVCDLSGDKVTRDTCVLVSPWDFKVHDGLRQAAKIFGKEGLCPLMVDDEHAPLGDWNIWVVRKDLASCLSL